MRPDKSALDQKLLDVIQKRSVVKSVGFTDSMSTVPSIDDNNNQDQDHLRRAALVHDLASTHPQTQSSQPLSQSGIIGAPSI